MLCPSNALSAPNDGTPLVKDNVLCRKRQGYASITSFFSITDIDPLYTPDARGLIPFFLTILRNFQHQNEWLADIVEESEHRQEPDQG